MASSFSASLGLKEGEGPRTFRLFAFVFLLTAAAVLAKSAQREIFLAAYPRSAIPDAFLLSAGVLAASSLGITALAERLGLMRLSQLLLTVGAVLLGGAFVTLKAWPAGGAMTLYVTVEVLMSILLTQGWSVAAEAVDVRSAKRLLPLVGIGAGLAWTVGGFAIGALASRVGPSSLLLIAPVALLAALAVLRLISRADVVAEARPLPASGFFAGLASGLKYLITEPLTRVLAAIITIELVVEKITDYQLFAVAQDRFVSHPGGVASFMGVFFGVTGAVTLLAPLVSGRLLTAFGSTRALMAGQLWVLLGSVAFLLFPSFVVVVLLTGGDRILKQSLTAPGRSQVFGALPSVRRAQAGSLLRGVLAAAFSALGALGLKALPTGLPVQWLSVGTAVLLLGLLFLTARDLRKAYLTALQRSVDRTRLDFDVPGARRELDREQLTTISEELTSGDDGRALLAVSLLGSATPATARPLLHQALLAASVDVRAHAAGALGRLGAAQDATAVAAALGAASEDSVRLACLEALAGLEATSALPAIAALCDAPTPSVRALARVCRTRILELGPGVRGAAAEVPAIEAMLGSSVPEEREAAAWAAGRVPLGTTELRERFTALFDDESLKVRRAAIGAAGQFTDEELIRKLVFALGAPDTTSAAFDAFTHLGDEGVGTVERVLVGAPAEVVSRAASALAQGTGERATDVLQKLLDHADPQVRYRASRALVHRRRSATWRPPGEELLLRSIETELAQGYRYHATLAGLARQLREGDAEMRFVAGELESRTQETERRLLALVGVVADPRIARLSHHLRDASPQVNAKVLELVEQSLDPRLSRLVVPFLERQSAEKKAQIGVRRFQVPEGYAADPLGTLLQLGDDHLRLVAHLAFKGRMAGRSPALTNEENTLLQLVERLRFLRSVPVFKDLSPEDLMKLAEIAAPVVHRAGKVIFKKGDPGDVLCVVVKGGVEIRDQGQVIATQKANDFFGELALFDQEPRSADAVCVQDTELLEIGGADLESLMERRPEIAREIIRVLARRLRKTTHELVGRTVSSSSLPAVSVPKPAGRS